MPPNKDRVKLSQACSHCRKKKVKCDGAVPCGNCLDREKQCTYPILQRRGRKNHGQRVIHSRVDPIATIEPPNGRGECNMFFDTITPDQSSFAIAEARKTPIPPETSLSGPSQPSPNVAEAARSADQLAMGEIASSPSLTRTLNYGNETESFSGKPPTPRDSEIDREEATMDLQAVNWEHHGPGSWLSICSSPGLQWVCVRIGTTRFHQVAQGLVMGWTSRLTLASGTVRERSPEPDVQKAWIYVSAFFEQSHDSIFGAVFRPDFETRLRAHLQDPGQHDEDVAWYALRNAVYAVGCRTAGSMDGSRNFLEDQQESLRFFHNAFSVLSDLLFMPSGLMAVQALLVMTSFAELLGSPAVEYMLCASAARLAQSKGLHRHPSRLWKLPNLEILQRSWVFWAVYCYENYIALRSGRPSTFDDVDISCEIPSSVPEGSTLDIEVFSAVIAHARICSEIIKNLCSVKAFNQRPEALFQIMRELEERLEEWRKLLPDHLKFAHHNDSAPSRYHYRHKANILRLHYLYWGSIIALNANFHYPWICSALTRQNLVFDDLISKSSACAAEASRQILSALKDASFDTSFPSPIAFYFPMLAVINLFVYILKNPTFTTVQSDLAHLDLAAGHFAKIHFLTSSQVSFTFPREIVGLASEAIRMSSFQTAGYTAQSLPVDISPEPSVFDPIAGFDQLNDLSVDFFEGFPPTGDMIIF